MPSTVREALEEYSDSYLGDCNSEAAAMYKSHFQDYLSDVPELYRRMQSEVRVITDAELETILVELPLKLFMVSEGLNSLRLSAEVIKLQNKDKRDSLTSFYMNEFADIKPASDKKEAVARKVTEEMIAYESALAIYNSVISRVENETSFARELIMSAKKIWDSRRSAERSNPISEVSESDFDPSQVPEYKRNTSGKSYIG